MIEQWNDELLDNFVDLHDALRTAKKQKDYQHVLSLGQSALELDTRATFDCHPHFSKKHGAGMYQTGRLHFRHQIS